MGVDLYVGTLTRYFAGDWKTVVQQIMETGTLSAPFKPKHEPLDPSVDRQAIQTDVDRWRRGSLRDCEGRSSAGKSPSLLTGMSRSGRRTSRTNQAGGETAW